MERPPSNTTYEVGTDYCLLLPQRWIPREFLDALPGMAATYCLWWGGLQPSQASEGSLGRPSLASVVNLLTRLPDLIPGLLSALVPGEVLEGPLMNSLPSTVLAAVRFASCTCL